MEIYTKMFKQTTFGTDAAFVCLFPFIMKTTKEGHDDTEILFVESKCTSF